MEPERYIKNVLIEQIHAKCIVAGDDVSYGRHGAGDYRLLQKKSSVYGYQVIIIDKVLCARGSEKGQYGIGGMPFRSTISYWRRDCAWEAAWKNNWYADCEFASAKRETASAQRSLLFLCAVLWWCRQSETISRNY